MVLGTSRVQPNPYRFGTTYETFSYSTYDDAIDINEFGGGFRLNDDQGNPFLKPEIKTEFEIGTDLRFFKDRFSIGATYYRNEIKDFSPCSESFAQFRIFIQICQCRSYAESWT
ncbi:MAG: TonB-dependent receptor [Saprospiraceae bacterium]|nr:TonB-dependent receptor [Saprospiraceae bacterium]